MATAGVMLSDLEGGGGGDGDLVQKILADMKMPAPQSGMQPVPQAMPQMAQMSQMAQMQQMPQMATSTSGFTMDSRIPTSHVIGNEHPTPADFAAAIYGNGNQMMGAPLLPGVQQQQMTYEAPSKNIYGKLAEELKIPFVVALLFFIFSLPPIRVLVAHYIPSFIKPTGEYMYTGLLLVSVLVGSMFWILQRVIAPLLSL
jgi:hypothetical protein